MTIFNVRLTRATLTRDQCPRKRRFALLISPVMTGTAFSRSCRSIKAFLALRALAVAGFCDLGHHCLRRRFPRGRRATISRRLSPQPKSGLEPRSFFTWLRFAFDSRRRSLAARERLRLDAPLRHNARLRGSGRTGARAHPSRLRSCVRKLCAWMTSTPSSVSRRPARRSRRARTSPGSDGEPRTIETQLHRRRHLVDVLPARSRERTKRSSSSDSSMSRSPMRDCA